MAGGGKLPFTYKIVFVTFLFIEKIFDISNLNSSIVPQKKCFLGGGVFYSLIKDLFLSCQALYTVQCPPPPSGRATEKKTLSFDYTVNTLNSCLLNLSYDGGFTDLSFIGGGAQSAPPIFICENHRKSNKIMHCVEKKNIRLAVLKIKPFFT